MKGGKFMIPGAHYFRDDFASQNNGIIYGRTPFKKNSLVEYVKTGKTSADVYVKRNLDGKVKFKRKAKTILAGALALASVAVGAFVCVKKKGSISALFKKGASKTPKKIKLVDSVKNFFTTHFKGTKSAGAKKPNIFSRIGNFFKNHFKTKPKP